MEEKKLLIVDYEEESLRDLSDLFSSHGLQVITALDGEEAYFKYQSENPSLIILEAMLPKLHGFDLAKKISEETQGTIPMIIVTGLYKGAKYRNEAIYAFGVAEYFEKPFDKEKLVGAVMNLLHDEIHIEEELPSKEEVTTLLEEMADTGISKNKME